jgi:hypothetical protein
MVFQRTSSGRRTRLVLGLLTCLALVVGLGAPAAFAAGPSREPLALPDSFSLAAGDACAFPVRIDILVNGEYTTTFPEENGETRILTTGRLIVGLVNESSGRQIIVNISGPALTVVHADGSSTVTLSGESLPLIPGQLPVTSGPVVQEYAPDGSLVSTSGPDGHVRDMCVELSS